MDRRLRKTDRDAGVLGAHRSRRSEWIEEMNSSRSPVSLKSGMFHIVFYRTLMYFRFQECLVNMSALSSRDRFCDNRSPCGFQKDDFGKVSGREMTGSGTVAGKFRGHLDRNDCQSLLDEISRQGPVLVSPSHRSCVKNFGIENEKAYAERSQNFVL
jgi:hypothetical protein